MLSRFRVRHAGGRITRVVARLPSNNHAAALKAPRELTGLRHRDDIQGLRAIAVLLVVLGHAGVPFLKGGYVGVDVFFVLSGFLITTLLLSDTAKSRLQSLIDFYSRRARRILPAAALTLVVTDIVAYKLLNFVRAKQVLADSVFASLFSANIHFAKVGTNYFAQSQPPSPLQNFWSLAVEEQFYVVWPLVLSLVLLGVVLRRHSVRMRDTTRRSVTVRARHRLLVAIGLITIGSLVWSLYYTNAHPSAAYFSTFGRAWELGIGATLAITADAASRVPAGWRAAAGWLGVVAIAAAAAAFTERTPFPGDAALLPAVGAALMIAAGLGERQSRAAVGRLLSTAPFRYVGDRSYAYYLWHWPVLILVAIYEGHSLSLGVKLLLVAGAFLLSILSYGLFENPLRRMRWSSTRHALVLWPVSVGILLLVAGWGTHALDAKSTRLAETASPQYPGLAFASARAFAAAGAEHTLSAAVLEPAKTGGALPAVAAAVQAAQRGAPISSGLTPPFQSLLADHFDYPSGCSAAAGQNRSNVCTLGKAASRRSLVVLGDSHSAMWMPAIIDMAQHHDWAVRPIEKDGCIPADWWHIRQSAADCRAWLVWAVGEVKALHPDVTVLGGDLSVLVGKDAVVTAGIGAMLAQLKEGSSRVVVIEDAPRQSRQPIDCLLAAGANMARCSATLTPDALAYDEHLSAAVRGAGAAYLLTRGWFCAMDRCPMVIGHMVAYTDVAHVSATYATRLGPAFSNAFRGAVRSARA